MEYGIFQLIILSIFINNFVLARFLGLCPYMGVSKQLDSAFGMGMAVTFVMTIASLVTWLLYTFFLAPTYQSIFYTIFNTPIENIPDLTFLRTIVFILVIASLVQFIEMYIQKVSPTLYKALGIYLPLITTNCAILGVAILTIQKDFNLIEGVVFSISHAIGFGLALILFAGIREHLDLQNVPKG